MFLLKEVTDQRVSVQGGSLTRGVSVQGVSVQGVSVRGVSVQRGLCLGRVSVRETPCCSMVMCRRYTSYWNAFLLP